MSENGQQLLFPHPMFCGLKNWRHVLEFTLVCCLSVSGWTLSQQSVQLKGFYSQSCTVWSEIFFLTLRLVPLPVIVCYI